MPVNKHLMIRDASRLSMPSRLVEDLNDDTTDAAKKFKSLLEKADSQDKEKQSGTSFLQKSNRSMSLSSLGRKGASQIQKKRSKTFQVDQHWVLISSNQSNNNLPDMLQMSPTGSREIDLLGNLSANGELRQSKTCREVVLNGVVRSEHPKKEEISYKYVINVREDLRELHIVPDQKNHLKEKQLIVPLELDKNNPNIKDDGPHLAICNAVRDLLEFFIKEKTDKNKMLFTDYFLLGVAQDGPSEQRKLSFAVKSVEDILNCKNAEKNKLDVYGDIVELMHNEINRKKPKLVPTSLEGATATAVRHKKDRCVIV